MPNQHRPGYYREYMRKYRAEGRDKSRIANKTAMLPFVGCDGEGTTLANGYHAYFMLTIGDETIYPSDGNERLTTRECLEFISSRDPNACYVGYFFDYDVTKIVEDLPLERLHKLISRSDRTFGGKLYPLEWKEFQLEYLPRKEFKVRKRTGLDANGAVVWSQWIAISDVGSFFQVSFLKAIQQWQVGSDDDRFAIEQGKRGRATFYLADSEAIAEYNALEIELLQRLMDRFRDACTVAGYIPRKWQGPGLLAESMFKKHGVTTSRKVELLQSHKALVQFGLNAYYGGRTEVMAIGPVTGTVYQYDINSAYPYAMQFVPCLEHGEWVEYENAVHDASTFDTPCGRKGERYALLHASFYGADSRTLWYGLPVRTKAGSIVFPERGSGWYWSFEIAASKHQRSDVVSGWVYTRTCDCRPLAFVADVYETRKRIGKDGPGVVLKLGMNSLYGKTVQSIGYPKYANPIWGSFLTSFPRMMLNDFIHGSQACLEGRCGTDVLMVATDSVTTSTRRSDYEGYETALGGWSKEVHPRGVFVVQPGVYFGSSGKPSKTRGVPKDFIEAFEPVFRDAFDIMVDTGEMADGNVRVPQKLFVGVRYAVHRRNLKLLGQWIEFGEGDAKGKVISFDWTTKRVAWPVLAPTAGRSYLQTYPYEGDTSLETVPYSKDIGGLREREELRMVWQDQPDWAIGGVFDD